jgi:uncharacterized membrane protein
MKERWLTMRKFWREVAPTGSWLAVALVLSVGLSLAHSPLVPLPGVITLLLVPGAAVMSLLKTRPATTAGRVVLAVSLSMMAIMVVGGVASLIGPHVGVTHPLNPLPESVIWIVLAFLVLRICETKRRDPVTWVFEGVRSTNVSAAFAGGALVVLSILGVAQLNYSDNNHLAVFSTFLDVVVLLAGIAGGATRTARWPMNTMLYAASLALLLSTSLRGAHLYGWDVQQEFGVASQTLHSGVWVIPSNHDPYASMLSLTVLPTVLHTLFRLRLLAFFQLVVPAILALLPLAVFSTIRSVPRWITSGRPVPRPGIAFAVVVGLVVSSAAFSTELVSITRQAMALTILAALVMVLFDRTMLKRPAQVIVGLLIVTISFTHYTTSYLLAAILICAWPVGLLWSRGWLGTPKARIKEHRYDVHSRKIINVVLVVVALVAAFGWNLGITRNDALDAPSSALSTKGVGFSTSTNSTSISPRQFERLLVSEMRINDSWIVPVPGSDSVPLVAATIPSSPGLVPSLAGAWQELNYLDIESIWLMLGIALLYGLFRLGRRRSYEYTSDLVGLAITGILIGAVLRFSGTLATYYDPERAAIFTAILLAAPLTLFLDDVVSYVLETDVGKKVTRTVLSAGSCLVAILVIGATGLGALFFGGQPPGSLSARDYNGENFVVSTTDVATAVWLLKSANSASVVQSDYLGQLVLLSEPGSYDLVNKMMPPVVDEGAYVYLSSVNLTNDLTQAEADGYDTAYRTTFSFFNRNFYVVFSTGDTRVYH